MPPRLTFLESEERQCVIDTALALLEKIGVQITDSQAKALLLDAGAAFRDSRAYIPAELVQSALDSAPDKITIFNRSGNPVMDLSGQNYYFGAHTDAPDILDPCTGIRRPCLENDVRKNAALVENLDNICFLTASGLIADCSPDLADRLALAHCLEVSSKPVLVMPVTLASLEQMRAMAVIAVNCELRFRQQPNLIVYAEPVSPLAHPDESLRKLVYCAEHEIPVAYVPYAARGATAPMSQSGILAQLTAESLSALVIHQLYRPGAPFIFGGMASIMDMRSTIFSYGAPEFQLGNTMMVEIAHQLNLPNFGTAGTSDAQLFDGQAIMEASSSSMLAALSGAHLVHDVGLIGSATLISPALIAATNEIASMLKKITAEVQVNHESLSLDLFAPVTDKGEFMTDPYTLAHFREVWYPELLYRGGAKRWEFSQQEAFTQRVNRFTCERWQQPAETTLSAERSLAIRQLIRLNKA
jgi:trimethylamine---corrinoid protein Co-methyltransferase